MSTKRWTPALAAAAAAASLVAPLPRASSEEPMAPMAEMTASDPWTREARSAESTSPCCQLTLLAQAPAPGGGPPPRDRLATVAPSKTSLSQIRWPTKPDPPNTTTFFPASGLAVAASAEFTGPRRPSPSARPRRPNESRLLAEPRAGLGLPELAEPDSRVLASTGSACRSTSSNARCWVPGAAAESQELPHPKAPAATATATPTTAPPRALRRPEPCNALRWDIAAAVRRL
mmetsp:Transcript_25725/g.41227  ORF Transcript_25725/g.41227 Transcript_25725/m.41227 type:complete len:232 (+) Transcript_25725:125-820(+)